MSFGALSDEQDIMSEINMTPLVDVMLVLLIVFMITVPVMQHSVKLDLPQAKNQPHDARPPHITVSVEADGRIVWDGAPVSNEELSRKIAVSARQTPQPELHLYADRQTRYEQIAQVMAVAQAGGLMKIGFVTDPRTSQSR